jgi:hypothetical protein
VQKLANQCFGDVKYTLNIVVNSFKNFYISQLLFSAGGSKLGIIAFKSEHNLDYAGFSDFWKAKMETTHSYETTRHHITAHINHQCRHNFGFIFFTCCDTACITHIKVSFLQNNRQQELHRLQ